MKFLIFDLQEIVSSFMVLFATIDVFGSIPIIINLRKKSGKIHSSKASWVALIIMILFLFLGENILKILSVDINSFAVAGALILFFLALEMILGISLYKEDEQVVNNTTSIVPLAFPIIAGPGSLTSILSIRAEFSVVNIVIGIILNIALVYYVLKSSVYLEKILGTGGINIIRKIFGIILLAISVKLFAENASQLIK